MRKEFDRKLVLEGGAEYYGYGFGDGSDAVTEIVFNTSMVGYQEIVSDPSYTYQTVVMTYPLIGNYGMADEDFETRTPTLGGLVVREYNDSPSNFRYTKTLSEIMEEPHPRHLRRGHPKARPLHPGRRQPQGSYYLGGHLPGGGHEYSCRHGPAP